MIRGDAPDGASPLLPSRDFLQQVFILVPGCATMYGVSMKLYTNLLGRDTSFMQS